MIKRAILAWICFSVFSAPAHTQDNIVTLADPYFHSSGAWGQSNDDQWALKAVGMSDPEAVWDLLGPTPAPVTVAIVDTGIDWFHMDLDADQLWSNPGEIAANGLDDDGNGYVDDLIGWDFITRSNKPWDYDGHGTITAGIVAALPDNGIGITGMNPNARIMVVRALDSFGNTHASYIAEAITYAVDNGARIINLSVGGLGDAEIARLALDYAAAKGVLVVVAAGNEASDLEGYGLVNHPSVVTVAATTPDGERANFSNWGGPVSIAAPGVDVLSLRARRTDTLLNLSDQYVPGSAFVGPDNRYYVATGTSFSAPFVTGAASLLLSRDPDLTAPQLKRILLQSARDIGTPGLDQFSGFGELDVLAALSADVEAFTEASIASVQVVQSNGQPAVNVIGTARSDALEGYRIDLGAGNAPSSWTNVTRDTRAVTDGVIATIPASRFSGSSVWIIRLTVTREDGTERSAQYQLNLG